MSGLSFAYRWWSQSRLNSRDQKPDQTLRLLLTQAQKTRFGLQHGFSDLLTQRNLYEAFVQRVPIMDYSGWLNWLGPAYHFERGQAKPLIHQAWPGTIDWFCLSSGTSSGKTKFIPYSREMARQNRRAALTLLATLLQLDRQYHPLARKTLYMSGSTALARNEAGALCGDMSALTKFLAPKPLAFLTGPPESIARLEPWRVRLEALVGYCLTHAHKIAVLSGIPVWQVSLLEALQEQGKQPVSALLPELKFLIHGGMSITPYQQKLRELLDPRTQFFEVYAASEMGIVAAGPTDGQGMTVMEGYGVFYEFEDGQGRVWPPWAVQAHQRYQLIVTSCSGLWRYRVGDEVSVTHTSPLALGQVGRSQTMTAFDEKVTEGQVLEAFQSSSTFSGDFCVGPDLVGKCHVWFLVGDGAASELDLSVVDERLRALNQDYDDYRGDGRIAPPTWRHWKHRSEFLTTIGRVEGGQRKWPRLLRSDEVRTLLNARDAHE